MPVHSLEDAFIFGHELVGGKAINLGKLIGQGFPVPPGFVVTTQAYSDHFARLFARLSADTDVKAPGADVNERNKTIRRSIIQSPVPQQLEVEIFKHHRIMQQNCEAPLICAVRSSATAEDLTGASFAGQHESYYYVDSGNLILMIKNCWASLWSDAACSYRAAQGVEDSGVKMAVIVQLMIPADVSGITFTADPVTGDESVIVTESSWGMGAAIVDGRVTPDQYILDRETRAPLKTRVASKRYMVSPEPVQPEETRLTEVPPELQNVGTLSEDQVQLLAYYAIKAEQYFGSCQDIEWAFKDNEFYLLQSRPITRMGEHRESLPPGKHVLFKPLAENFTSPLLPLTQDLMSRSFPVLKIIYGRAYINLSLIRPLVPFKLTDTELANIVYLNDKGIDKPRLAYAKIFRLVPLIAFLHLLFGVFYARTRNMPDDFMDSFRQLANKVGDDDSINAPGAITRLFFSSRFFEPVGNMVLIINSSAGRYFFLLAAIRFLLRRWIPESPAEVPSLITSGSKGVLSADMGRQILGLANLAKTSPIVKNLIMSCQPSEVMAALSRQSEAKPFLEALNGFLKIHGHRALKEFELSSVRWEENPVILIKLIRNYLPEDDSLVKTGGDEGNIHQKRDQLLGDIKSRLEKLPFERLTRIRWKLLNSLASRCRYFIKLRENSRFFHIMVFYVVRKKILKLESRFLAHGKLKCADDIFYLHWQEIEKLDSDQLHYQDIENLIQQRRMAHIRLTKMTAPRTIGIEPPPEAVNKTSTSNTSQLEGYSASPGVYEGIARVILDPSTDTHLLPGEILIAPYTDPAWTPLFLIAHAAVIETGSYLSHAGTVAREYGMPCVVDVPDCTTLISTGDHIRVDGSLGRVTLNHSSNQGPE